LRVHATTITATITAKMIRLGVRPFPDHRGIWFASQEEIVGPDG
jgi:hypothetical protein